MAPSADPARPYRVIQWATGHIGKAAIRHFTENPAFDLVGVVVTNPKKVGKDAGEIAGIGPIGLLATDQVDEMLALKADCLHFSPLEADVDTVCRFLRAGTNVVSPLGPFYRTERTRPTLEKIDAACREGGTSFHGSGIHPGFAGDLLPLTLARVMNRIDHIHLYEVIDHLANPSNYIEFMGFGRDPEEFLANPNRSPEAPLMFAESMTMVAEALGLEIDNLTTKLSVAVALEDIEHRRGVVKAGTVAGQHYEWTGWANGAPLITYHCFWTMGDSAVKPRWECGPSGYRIRIEGDPPMECTLMSPPNPEVPRKYLGLPWTAMAGVNVIPDVCDAAPGVITHFDLGVARPRGLFATARTRG